MGPAAERAGHAEVDGRRSRGVVAALVLCVVVLATFASVLAHDFVIWDDNLHVTNNPTILEPSLDHLREVWRRPMLGLYVPLSYTLFMLEVWIAKSGVGESTAPLDPRIFHAVQILLHLACVLLVYRILRRILAAPWPAALGALVFGVHPLQVESVAWISETRGVLSAVLALAALDLYLAHARRRAPNSSDAPAVSWQIVAATVCFAGSLLAKPASVALPVIALIFDRWLVRRPWRDVLATLSPWFVLALLATWVNKLEQSDRSLDFVPPLWARPFIATDALAFYLGKLVWPTNLVADYGRTPERILGLKALFFSWVAPAACVAALFFARERRLLAIGLAVFAAALLPVLGLVPFAYQDISTVADRYGYFAMLGPALLVGALLAMHRNEVVLAAAAVIVVALAVASRMQARTWRDTRTLFERVLEVNPKSAVALHNLGLKAVLDGRSAEALQHYSAAIELDPDHLTTHNNLGLLYLQQNDIERAAGHFREALRIDPKYARARVNLSAALYRLGRPGEAEAEVRTALADDPNDDGAHNNLGNFLMAKGQTRGAVAEFEAALASRENNPDVHRNLARALFDVGERERARIHIRRALAQRPGSPQFERDLAWFLATDPGAKPADAREAVDLAERAASRMAGEYRTHDVLAAAYAAAGRKDDAVRACDRAIELAKATSPDRVNELTERRRIYAAGAAYRVRAAQ